MMDLQEKYWNWQTEGLDLDHAFVQECVRIARDILTVFREDCDAETRCLSEILINDHDTFELVWFDDQKRLCCTAMIEDGAPMGWRVEFLDLHLKRELHQLLQGMLNELSLNVASMCDCTPNEEVTNNNNNNKEVHDGNKK